MRYRAIVPVLVALLALAFVSSADALTQRPFKETFGPAAQPAVELSSGITIDRTNGDVLIGDQTGQKIERFHADGTPAPFAALGSNTIDGAEANGKPCAEEPASCDKTRQNGIAISQGPPAQYQIAIDESHGVADGDIYLSQGEYVDIFSEDGEYLGQLTEAGVHGWVGGVKGIAVGPDGTVYVGNYQEQISKFVPKQNPVVNVDLTANIPYPDRGGGSTFLEFGAGPSAGTLFGAYSVLECIVTVEGNACSGVESILQLNPQTGAVISQFDKGHVNGNREVRGWIAVDPLNGNVLDGGGLEFEVPNGSPPVKVSRLIPEREVRGGLVVNGANEVLVGEGYDPSRIAVYGHPATVPAVTTEPASEVGGTRVTLGGTVNPQGLPVTDCVFQYAETNSFGFLENVKTAPCEGDWKSSDSTPHAVSATVTGLQSGGHPYVFRLIAYNQNGQEETAYEPFTTAHTVVTESAVAIGPNSATLVGVVRPEGEPYTACFFEYGLSSNRDYEKTVPCSPGFSAIPGDSSPHEVKAAITGLQTGETYRYRLVATDGAFGTLKGEDQFFSTLGVPRIVEAQASSAGQRSLTLEARIDPSGYGTSYRFEWGQMPDSYGNLAPVEFEPFIGSGTEAILVKAQLTGLAPGSTYHYRVTATSSRGTIHSPDQVAETLNECKLPEGRCYELVSRREAGPVAIPGEGNAHIEMHFQAATGGPGALAYEVESGYPEASKGAEVLYRANRGTGEWDQTQLSTPINALDERNDGASVSDAIEFLSNDLSCGFVESVYPLPSTTPPMKLVLEEGGSNLYRINPDNTYTPISTLPPKNAKGVSGLFNYGVAGGSQNCDVAVFTSSFEYPGIDTVAGAGEGRLYEWRDGTLRNGGVVPGPDGKEVIVGGYPGFTSGNGRNNQNTVSEDGSRFFFTAERQTSPTPGEVAVGVKGIFVREDGRETRDVSLSEEPSTPDTSAVYQWATADGSKVFFTANAGLTAESNGSGTDLYEYNLETEKLTDRSMTAAEGGAEVDGFVGGSTDGSVVYFDSRNQLVPGKGNSRAQNVTGKTFSIYREQLDEKGDPGEISFAGTFNERDRQHVVIENQSTWTAQVSPDGRYLLFESSAPVTAYESHEIREGYLFDAGSQELTCVTCRQDGQPSTGERYGHPSYEVFARGEGVWNPLHGPRFLAERNGQALVFFNSPDPLAPGAVEGQNNIYEWSHNQIFRLTSAPAGSQAQPYGGYVALFAGASDDGNDIYLTTPETLSWEDGDQRFSAYDARIGGGYPKLPEPPAKCEALSEGEGTCAGGSQSVTAPSVPATTGDAGAQNLEPKKKNPPKKKQKKHKKKQHKKAKGKKKSKGKKSKGKKSNRQANSDRRNGK